MKLKVGSIIHNNVFYRGLTQSTDFKVGYYKIVDIREGMCVQYLKGEEKLCYVFVGCTKNGKLFKKDHVWFVPAIDKMIDQNIISVIL